MGTRADFYVGRGDKAEWIGSIAWDGYPEPYVNKGLFSDGDEATWRKRVADFLATRDDATQVADGWPWPWEDSGTTDWSYTLDDGVVYCSCFGRAWLPVTEYLAKQAAYVKAEKAYEAGQSEDAPNEDWWDEISPKAKHPNMKAIQNVTLGKRSGVIIMGG